MPIPIRPPGKNKLSWLGVPSPPLPSPSWKVGPSSLPTAPPRPDEGPPPSHPFVPPRVEAKAGGVALLPFSSPLSFSPSPLSFSPSPLFFSPGPTSDVYGWNGHTHTFEKDPTRGADTRANSMSRRRSGGAWRGSGKGYQDGRDTWRQKETDPHGENKRNETDGEK
eukprot:scaffold626_cov337-Pavlova_lutheri.AAC.11